MTAKEKLIGIVLIVIGALPFLLKIKAVGDVIGSYKWILPGEIIYQIVLIVLGVLLIWTKRQQLPAR